jgi:hypothetical protein
MGKRPNSEAKKCQCVSIYIVNSVLAEIGFKGPKVTKFLNNDVQIFCLHKGNMSTK